MGAHDGHDNGDGAGDADDSADKSGGRADETEKSSGTPDSERVNFAVTVEDGETILTMRGDRDTAVIVRSESGERIYLPPEDFEREAERHEESPYRGVADTSPYQRAGADAGVESESHASTGQNERDSPYQGVESDSAYRAARQQRPKQGLVPTADGYRIRHPEPVTDVRVLR